MSTSNSSVTALAPKQAVEAFRSDAGTLHVWRAEEVPLLKDAQVAASRFTLNRRALAVPQFSDSNQIYYVLEGLGLVGVAFPEATQEVVREVRKGDAVAVPFGSVHWWFNGNASPLSVLSLADTSRAHLPGLKLTVTADSYVVALNCQNAYLTGEGSVMRGFSTDFLAQAWDLPEATIETLAGSQKKGVFVTVGEGYDFPKPDAVGVAVDEVAAAYGEFVFNCEDAKKDVDVKNGGRVSVLSSNNLEVLKHIGLGADLVKLDPGAMCSPGFSADSAFQVTYLVRGTGRVQVVSNSGERVVDAQLKAGDFFIVPRFHAVSKRAGDQGLEWFSIITSASPVFSHLAGKTSVWKALSPAVLRAAFNVGEDVESQFRGRRTQDAIFFPPSTKQ